MIKHISFDASRQFHYFFCYGTPPEQPNLQLWWVCLWVCLKIWYPKIYWLIMMYPSQIAIHWGILHFQTQQNQWKPWKANFLWYNSPRPSFIAVCHWEQFANPGRCSQTAGKPTRSCHIQWRVEKSMVNMTTTQQPSTVNVGLVGQIGNIATFDSKSLYSAVIIGNSNLVYLVDTWLTHGYKSGKKIMPSWSPKWLLFFWGAISLHSKVWLFLVAPNHPNWTILGVPKPWLGGSSLESLKPPCIWS